MSSPAPLPPEAQQPYLALKVMMMPKDTNVHGTIFGGVLLSHMDLAGVVGAHWAVAQAGWPSQPLVTVAMDKVEFHHPVLVGDVVSFWTQVVRVGRTSICMQVTVETQRDGRPLKVTEALITYVAVELRGSERRAVPIRGQ